VASSYWDRRRQERAWLPQALLEMTDQWAASRPLWRGCRWIEGKVLIGAIPQGILQIVVHAEAARITVLGLKGLQATPIRGCGKNLALLFWKRNRPRVVCY